MRLLLDTHAFIWWFEGSDRLPVPVRAAISEDSTDVFVSAASAWEIATKHRLGRLGDVDALALNIPAYMASQRFESLSVTIEDGVRAGALPGPLRDPLTGCWSRKPSPGNSYSSPARSSSSATASCASGEIGTGSPGVPGRRLPVPPRRGPLPASRRRGRRALSLPPAYLH